jgi:hypothetical protein
MVIAVRGNIEIPHIVGVFGKILEFFPSVEIDENNQALIKWAEGAIKNSSHVFYVPDGSIDISQYKVKNAQLNNMLESSFNVLPSEDRYAVIQYAKSLLNKKPHVLTLDEMTIAQMREYADSRNIDVPDTITKKADILGYIKEKEKV